MKILGTIIFFLILSEFAFAQNSVLYEIDISAHGSCVKCEMKIHIRKYPEFLKINYYFLDSIDLFSWQRDSIKNDVLLYESFSIKTDAEMKRFIEKVETWNAQFHFYKTDSIYILNADNQAYVNLLDTILFNDNSTLERNEYGKGLICLDGTSFYIDIKKNNLKIKSIYAHSPIYMTKSLIDLFLISTINFYRIKHKDSSGFEKYLFW